jgi:ABC-type Fe3+-siderophore transport system permease subunit
MAMLFFNAIVVLFTPQSTFREPLAMTRFVVGLIAASLIYAAARKSRRGLNYALLWIFTLGLALNESQLPI